MIYLIRHVRPSFDTSQRVVGGDLGVLVAAYDRADIVSPVPPLSMDSVGKVFSSHIPRAERSARAFFPGVEPDINEVFREAAVPKRVPLTTGLRFNVVVGLARCLWLCGYAPDVESITDAKRRAELAATLLEDAEARHAKVALVGHGFFNRMIGRSLRRRGRKLASSSGNGFASVRAYRRICE